MNKNTSQKYNVADESVLAEIYREMGKMAVSKVGYMIKDPHHAQDIVHDAFIKLHASGSIFPSKKSIYKWIYVACHRMSIDYMKSAPVQRYASAKHITEFKEPGCVESRLLNRNQLLAITHKFNKEDLNLLFYRHVDGLSMQEMSEMTNLSERTLRRRFVRIDKKLVRFK